MHSEERKPLPLLHLPPELFERILVHLAPVDIFACAATCKLLHAAVSDSPLLQYHIELETAGLEEGQGHARGIQDRLKALRTYKKRWETLDWRSETRAPFWESGNIWDLYGGVFGQGNMGTRGRGFHFTRLPSKVLGLDEAHSWEFPNINVDGGVRDFSFEPSQNLLVLLDMKSWPLTVHLRTLTTNEPHPRAAKPVFEYMREGAQSETDAVVDESYYLQIMGGDMVAILRLPRTNDRIPLNRLNELVFFNWRTGKLVTTLRLPDVAILTFSFVSHCHFVVGVGDHDDDQSGARLPLPSNPRLQVYRFDPATLAPPIRTCTLLMPELHDAFCIGYLLTRSDPAPGTPVPAQRPFGASSQDRILVVTLTIRKRQTGTLEEVVNFFVHMSTLLDFSTPLEREGLSIDIPWELWAHRARVIPSRFEPTWVCYVHGMRFIVAIGVTPGQEDLVQACVFDFNQLALRKAKHELENKIPDPVETVEVITIEEEQDESTDADGDARDGEWEDDKQAQVRIISVPTMHHSEAFKKPIVSGLPFRRMVSPVHLACSALMLDDDNIVCVKEDVPRRLVFLTL